MTDNQLSIYLLLCMAGREGEAIAYKEKCEKESKELNYERQNGE